MTLRECIEQGLNEVHLDVEEDDFYVVTLSHRATTDNAVTICVPKGNVFAWADYDTDEAIEQGIKDLIV